MSLVYVMAYGPMDHKIGVSIAPPSRLKQLRAGGAARVVHCWLRPEGDARAVEAAAHRLLGPWRFRITGQRERFEVGEEAARRAVECAITLAEEARTVRARREALRAALAEPPVALPELPAHGRHWGYVQGPDAPSCAAECDALAAAGVPLARLHVDIGAPGRGLRAVARAVEEGDVLVVTARERLSIETRAALEELGVALHALAA